MRISSVSALAHSVPSSFNTSETVWPFHFYISVLFVVLYFRELPNSEGLCIWFKTKLSGFWLRAVLKPVGCGDTRTRPPSTQALGVRRCVAFAPTVRTHSFSGHILFLRVNTDSGCDVRSLLTRIRNSSRRGNTFPLKMWSLKSVVKTIKLP